MQVDNKASIADAPAEGGDVVEAPVTEAERQAMIADVTRQTQSLTQLLERYRQMENSLKEDVMEFVLRDVNEHNMHIGIARRVAAAQQRLLNDAQYVGWAVKHAKGEFAARGSGASSNGEGDGAARDNKNLDPLSTWLHAALPVCIPAFGDESNAAPASPLPVALPLASLVVPPRFALTLCHGHGAIESTDRVVAEKQRLRFTSFVDRIEKWKADVAAAAGVPPSQLLLCLNGIPLVTPDAVVFADAAVGSARALDFTAPPYEEKFGALLASWCVRSAKTPAAELFAFEGSARNRQWFAAALKQGSNTGEVMSTAATAHGDTLSLVPLSYLVASSAKIASLLCYGVVSEGVIVAVEPVLPLAALHLLCGFGGVADVKSMIDAAVSRAVLQPLYAAGVMSKRATVTFAIAAPAQQQHASSVVLLDVCELSPHLPTTLMSWEMDVCSVFRGQQQQTAAVTGGGASAILFKGQKARVANLEAVLDEIAEIAAAQTSKDEQAVVGQTMLLWIREIMQQVETRGSSGSDLASAAAAGSNGGNLAVKAGIVAGAVAIGALLLQRYLRSGGGKTAQN